MVWAKSQWKDNYCLSFSDEAEKAYALFYKSIFRCDFLSLCIAMVSGTEDYSAALSLQSKNISVRELSPPVVTCKQTATRQQFEPRADTIIFIIFTTRISHHEPMSFHPVLVSLVHLNDLFQLWV